MENLIGIMQGRLSPRPWPAIQRFPHETWEGEFETAKRLGFSCIEWLFDHDPFEHNPLWSDAGIDKIKSVIDRTGVQVLSLCAAYFISHPFFRVSQQERLKSEAVLVELSERASRLGINTILIPVLEEAALHTEQERALLIDSLKRCAKAAASFNIRLGIEAELEPREYLSLIEDIGSESVGIYYDTGNMACAGYGFLQSMTSLYHRTIAVHIKDRKLNGPSVFAGSGDVDFAQGISFLKKKGFAGNFVLETYFEEDYAGDALRAKNFLAGLIKGGAY